MPFKTFIVGYAVVLNDTMLVPCSNGRIGAATGMAFVNVLPKSVDFATRIECGCVWLATCRHAMYSAPVASSTDIVMPWLIGYPSLTLTGCSNEMPPFSERATIIFVRTLLSLPTNSVHARYTTPTGNDCAGTPFCAAIFMT